MRATLALLALVPIAVTAQRQPVVTEWPVPWPETRPRDPAVAPDGRIWFVGQVGNYVAALDPATGQFRKFDLEDQAFPHNITFGPDGAAWYTGNRNGTLGRMDPATGTVRRFPMPAADLTDPHTLVFAPGGSAWFTLQAANAVGHLDPASGAIRILRMPEAGSRPYGIALDSKGRPWFAEFGANRVGTIDPASFTLREYTLASAGARPRRLVITPDDRIWVGDYTRGKLVRLDPATGAFTEWQNPGGNRSAPYAMAVDDQGLVWQVETGPQPNQLVSFDPKTETYGTPVPISGSGGIVVRNMTFDRRTRSFWFGTDAGTIGRAVLGGGRAPAGATP